MFRILDYFFDKLIWSITDADPYSTPTLTFLDAKTHQLPQKFEFIDNSLIQHYDLKQQKGTSAIDIKIHRPVLVLRDRPYNIERSIEIDLGEMTMGFREGYQEGRFYRFPKKKVMTNTLIIDAKEMGIRMYPENVVMAEPFDLKIEITNPAFSPEIEKINTQEFDKSGLIDIIFQTQLNLHLTQDLYLYMLRCNDLNMSYTDSMMDHFNFRLNQDYFRSTEFLPKLQLIVKMPSLLINIYKQKPSQFALRFQSTERLTELAIREPQIATYLYLDGSSKLNVQFQSISSYFFDEQQELKHLLFGARTQEHIVDADQDMTAQEVMIQSEQNFNGMKIPQLIVSIDMQPNGGRKTMVIGINQTKLILQPYYFLMLQHFFQENMPTYDDDDFDKPNMFTSDIEDTGELTCNIIMNQILICFKGDRSSSQPTLSIDKEQVIGCLTQIEYQFSREKIKKVKNRVIEKAEKYIKETPQSMNDVQEPYFWMQLKLKELNPFICQYGDLKIQDLTAIKKRQIIENFSLTYHDGKFILWKPQTSTNKLYNRSKSELSFKKLLFKLSFTDYILLGEIYAYFNASFERFNAFYEKVKLDKLQNEQNNKFVDKSNILTSSRTAFHLMRSYTAAGQYKQSMKAAAKPSKRRDATRIGMAKIKSHQRQQNLGVIQEEEVMLSRGMFLNGEDEDIIDEQEEDETLVLVDPKFEVANYDISNTKIKSDGVHAVFINDLNGVFYPVISFTVTSLKFKSQEEFKQVKSFTQLKIVSSYYNLSTSLWEPFIEKLRLEYNQSSANDLALIIHKEVNINISTELLSNLTQTLNSMTLDKRISMETHDQMKQRLRETYSQTVIGGNNQANKKAVTQGLEVSLDQKLTLFTFVNMTSKNLTVYKIRGNNNQKIKFSAKPGQSVDFEVNYQEDAQNFDKWQIEELEYIKPELYHIKIEGAKHHIKNLNLRDQNFYHHLLNEREYIAYGVVIQNLKKKLVIRSPFCIQNNTFQVYRLKFLGANTHNQVEVKTVDLLPGASQPLDKNDEKLSIKFAPIFENSTSLINLEWSQPASVKTLVNKLQPNVESYIEHSHNTHYSIITKQTSDFKKTFTINIKSPLLIINCLPFPLAVQPSISPDQTNDDTVYQIPVAGQQEIFCFKLDKKINLKVSIQIDDQARFQEWSEILEVSLSDLSSEKTVRLHDANNQVYKLDLNAQISKSSSSGIKISFYAKNIIINNTGLNMKFQYDNKEALVAGQGSPADKSPITLVNNVKKIYASVQDIYKETKFITDAFNLDQSSFNNKLAVKIGDRQYQELKILTSLSQTQSPTVQTQITTISPSHILVNYTNYELVVSDMGISSTQQTLLTGERKPLIWSEKHILLGLNRHQNKCIKFKIQEDEEDSYEWSSGIKIEEMSKNTYLQWSETRNSIHIQVENFMDNQSQISFIVFTEESLDEINKQKVPNNAINEISRSPSAFSLLSEDLQKTVQPTYVIENKTLDIVVQVYQQTFTNHRRKLDPKDQIIFSWSNPELISNRQIILEVSKQGKDEIIATVEVQPDDLDFQHQLVIPHQKQQLLTKDQTLHVFTRTDGKSLRTVLSYQSRHELENPYHQMIEENGDQGQVEAKKVELIMGDFNISLMCKDSKGLRKEFCMLNLNGFHMLMIDQGKRREIQVKMDYIQLDNNASEKSTFPVVIYPKDIYSKRDFALKSKKSKSLGIFEEQQEFFNLHIQMRTDLPQVKYIESLEFQMQSLVVRIDDSFIVYLLRFKAAIEEDNEILDLLVGTKIKGSKMHPIFVNNTAQDTQMNHILQLIEERKFYDIQERSSEDYSQSEEDKTSKRSKFKISNSASLEDMTLNLITPRAITQKSQRLISLQSDRMSIMSKKKIESKAKLTWDEFVIQRDDTKVYIKKYKSGPVDIRLSIVTAAKLDLNGETAQDNFKLKDCAYQYGLNLANTEGAKLRLKSLEINNVFGSQNHITSQLTNHYIQRAKENILKLVFSVNMFGDPVNLISHFGTGFKEFYYKPKEGFIKGPIEGGKGLIKGTYSLVKNPVEGTFGSVSKFCSSMSKGMLFLTDDQKFINNRENDKIEKPSNPIEGLGFGLRYTINGVAHGISGVVEKPLQGAQQDGMKGFIKGTVKGVSGLIIMPISGVLDLISQTSEGVKNLVTSHDREVTKLRIQRPFYGKNQTIKIYFSFHAYINQHMIRINREEYSQDHFLDAIYYDDDAIKKVIIFTEENFLLVDGMKKQVLYQTPSSQIFKLIKDDIDPVTFSVYFKTDPTQPVQRSAERGQLQSDLVNQSFTVDVLKFKIADASMRAAYIRKIENFILYINEKQKIALNI